MKSYQICFILANVWYMLGVSSQYPDVRYFCIHVAWVLFIVWSYMAFKLIQLYAQKIMRGIIEVAKFIGEVLTTDR
ncbi:TPA: hypothetical protein DDW35_02675 [Candidatus Sumerlaeota bacterium]|nr:hypothetical protein [Candidatus Sumerlaeota bacterium]